MKPVLTSRGKGVLVASLTLGLIALFWLNAMWLQFALVGVMMVAFAFPLAYRNLQGVKCQHALPAGVYRSEQFTVEMVVENTKPDIGARDMVIEHSNLSDSGAFSLFVPYVAPNEAEHVAGVTMIQRRGIYAGAEYTIRSRFPLGLVETKIAGSLSGKLVVCPRPGKPRDVGSIMEAGVGYGGNRDGASEETCGDFRAIRDYRYGDHPRRISWPLSAKFQRLVVREWEQPCPMEVSIVYFNYEPHGVMLGYRSFENSLRLLSGLMEYLSEHRIPFEVTAAFTNWKPIAGSASSISRQGISSLLASARMQKIADMTKVASIVGPRSNGSAVQVLLSNTPKKYWEDSFKSAPEVYCMDNSDRHASKSRRARRKR
jgi:uncharacterized protein (DUF58 family)